MYADEQHPDDDNDDGYADSGDDEPATTVGRTTCRLLVLLGQPKLIGHDTTTSSPTGSPVERSPSNAACKTTVAAAASIRDRDDFTVSPAE